MFDLNTAIEEYLRTLGPKQLINRDCFDEMESHLRDEVDFLCESGLPVQQAFEQAIHKLGTADFIRSEYSKLYGANRMAQIQNWLSHYFDRRIVMKGLLGIVLGLIFMLVALVLEGGHVASIVQLTAFALVNGVAIGMSFLNRSGRSVLRSYHGFVRGDAVDIEHFRTVGRNYLHAGFVGAFVGMIQVVADLMRPDLIGPGLALAVVSILYGFCGYLFLGLAFETWGASDSGLDHEPVRSRDLLPLIAVPTAVVLALYFGKDHKMIWSLINIPGAIVVGAGIITVWAFVRKFRRHHFSYLANGAIAAGIVGCIFNFIHVMENLDKPDQIFVGLSVALMPVFYGVLLAMILRTMSRSDTVAFKSGHAAIATSLTPYCVATVTFLVVATVLVMYALRIS